MSRNTPLKAAVESNRTEQKVGGANFIGLTGVAHFCLHEPKYSSEKFKTLVCWWLVTISQVSQLYSPEGLSGLREDNLNMWIFSLWFYQLANPTIALYNKDNVWGAQNYKLWFSWPFTTVIWLVPCAWKRKRVVSATSPVVLHSLVSYAWAPQHLAT